MLEKENKTLRVSTFSRRQFLKKTTMAAAGVAISSIAISAGCKNAGIITSKPPENTTSEPPDSTSVTSNPTATSSTITTTTLSTTSTITTTSTTGLPITSYAYTPPTVLPPVLSVLNSPCVVAVDRSYTLDHLWIKIVSSNVAVLGVSTTLVEILFEPYKILLDKATSAINRSEAFGTIEGYKMAADLLSPVSGKILQVNDSLIKASNEGKTLDALRNDPYNSGWLAVILLSKPAELDSLITAQAYRDSIAKVGDI